jgi:hypothetical protein
MANNVNSSQRRKSKREFPHVIKLVAKVGERYFEHDDKVMVARNWCSRNCRGEYKVNKEWDSAEFKFVTERDAVVFALKWL